MINRIKETIKKQGLTIAKVEKELSFGNGSIAKWDKQSPSIDKVIKLANYLNVSLEWIATGKQSPELTVQEAELLNNFRTTDEKLKQIILDTSRSAARTEKLEINTEIEKSSEWRTG